MHLFIYLPVRLSLFLPAQLTICLCLDSSIKGLIYGLSGYFYRTRGPRVSSLLFYLNILSNVYMSEYQEYYLLYRVCMCVSSIIFKNCHCSQLTGLISPECFNLVR